MGLATAVALAAAGYHVTITVRSDAKGQAAVAKIKQSSADAAIEYAIMDNATLSTVQSFAASFDAPQLDLLVCNAGGLDDHIQDPLHRVFLPTTEEDWHLDENAQGLEALPMLSYEEVKKIGIVHKAMKHMRMNMTEEEMMELAGEAPS